MIAIDHFDRTMAATLGQPMKMRGFDGPWPTVPTNGSSTTVVMAMPEKAYRLRVDIVEDRSDDLMVSEARVRPGLVDPVRSQEHKSYSCGNRPKNVLTFSLADKEIENPVEGSVIVTPGECKVLLESRLDRLAEGQAIKTWSVFTKLGLSVCQLGGVLVRKDGDGDIATQVYRVNYADNADWGCLILRCTNEGLIYGNECYTTNELLTIFFHRTRDDYENTPYPPLLALSSFADQNYVPMLGGQILQVVPPPGTIGIDDLQSKGEKCLYVHSQERLTKNGKYWAYRYECARNPDVQQLLFVGGDQTASIIVPPLYREGDDVFAIITEPYRSVRVICDNLTSIRIRFARNIPVIDYPTRMLEIPRVHTKFHELTVRFLKKLRCLTIVNEKGKCSMTCTVPGTATYSPNSAGTK